MSKSCDTFVALPPATKNNYVIFGKNSDRPNGEVQEIILCPECNYEAGSTLQCTYIEIPQVSRTYRVILSKPAWMWGAEMGANDLGVCIGNEAVWTRLGEETKESLLGMDLVRLGLERSASARQAVDVITHLLEEFGQGGPCSDTNPSLQYCNSFLIADGTEAWVLETAGKLWAAEQVTGGVRNISNKLSIGTKMDLKCNGLLDEAKARGLWDGESAFNFASVFDSSGGEETRYKCGKILMEKHAASGNFEARDMFEILRDEESGICRGREDSFPSTSSQVSVITTSTDSRPSCHWFTGTPDPRQSVFKPFVFVDEAKISPLIQSPKFPEDKDPAKVKPRFQTTVDRSHRLYSLQAEALVKDPSIMTTLQNLERKCYDELDAVLDSFSADKTSELVDLFKDAVDSEIRFYKM